MQGGMAIRISINFGMIYFIYALTLIGMSLENKKNAHNQHHLGTIL